MKCFNSKTEAQLFKVFILVKGKTTRQEQGKKSNNIYVDI